MSHLFSSPLSQNIFVYEWPCLSVTLTEDQALHGRPHTHSNPKIMSDQLPNKYWESLSQNGLFLQSLFQGQHKQLQQLKGSNALLQSQVTDTRDDITNVASVGLCVSTSTLTGTCRLSCGKTCNCGSPMCRYPALKLPASTCIGFGMPWVPAGINNKL